MTHSVPSGDFFLLSRKPGELVRQDYIKKYKDDLEESYKKIYKG